MHHPLTEVAQLLVNFTIDCAPITPLWNNEITPNGLAQKGTTDFYNLEGKPM